MNITDPKIQRYLDGLAYGDRVQTPPGLPGDPQVAALSQYLQTKTSLKAEDIIVDFGSGAGMLPACMAKVWRGGSQLPWYFAVDQADELDQLAIPTFLHNHSRKIEVESFYADELPRSASMIKVVVVRNVLHELDIMSSARLLSELGRSLRPGCEIYVQDFARLPHGERGRAAWRPEVLSDCMKAIGFDCEKPVLLSSKSGTEWFLLLARPPHSQVVLSSVEVELAAARERQREMVIGELELLNSASDEATTPQYLLLQAEEAALATQLQQWNYSQKTSRALPKTQLFGRVPLVTIPTTSVDYAEEVAASCMPRSGLRAVVSSMNRLDFPSLLSTCRERAFFAGYSQRSLLLSAQNRTALKHAISSGTEIRILLANPESAATHARSQSLAYSSKGDLLEDIQQTQRAFSDFKRFVAEDLSAEMVESRCRLESTDSVPPCSYFILDDLCFASLYSQRLTGGSGPCLVYQEIRDSPNAYYSVLLQEFRLAWGDAW